MCQSFHTVVPGELYIADVLGNGRSMMMKRAFSSEPRKPAQIQSFNKGNWRAVFRVDLDSLIREAEGTCTVDGLENLKKYFDRHYLRFVIRGGEVRWEGVPKNGRNVRIAAAIGLNGRKVHARMR